MSPEVFDGLLVAGAVVAVVLTVAAVTVRWWSRPIRDVVRIIGERGARRRGRP